MVSAITNRISIFLGRGGKRRIYERNGKRKKRINKSQYNLRQRVIKNVFIIVQAHGSMGSTFGLRIYELFVDGSLVGYLLKYINK